MCCCRYKWWFGWCWLMKLNWFDWGCVMVCCCWWYCCESVWGMVFFLFLCGVVRYLMLLCCCFCCVMYCILKRWVLFGWLRLWLRLICWLKLNCLNIDCMLVVMRSWGNGLRLDCVQVSGMVWCLVWWGRVLRLIFRWLVMLVVCWRRLFWNMFSRV